ncbi:hypothetical protein LDENG_00015410, partial [Lucifuga dentata]
APTLPSVRSEVFKPCVEDKDLAFCLNEGECSIIETVAGVHRHCRCKEGYHGLRCDQFVPKTDAILSDPTDELGIEFMESSDTYQRQVLSIFSIASGICLLGVACMALYRRNKRHREKLRAHFDSRSLRDCSVSASGLMSKSAPRPQYSLQLQKGSNFHGSSVKDGTVAPGTSTSAPPVLCKALSKGKRFRSSSLSLSPAQQRREMTNFRTPPVSRGKHKISTNLSDGSRVAGHVYKHLQEDESIDMEPIRRCDSASGRLGVLLSRTSLSHFATRKGWTEVPCTRLDKGTTFLPPSLRTCSVPIIPSLQASDQEGRHVDASERDKEGLLKWHPILAGKSILAISSPPCVPPSVTPPTTNPSSLESEKNPSSTKVPFEISVELTQESKYKSLSSPLRISGSHSELFSDDANTSEAMTVQESEGKNIQCSPRFPHTCGGGRGLKTVVQRGPQRHRHGQGSLVYGGANSSLATKGSSRETGNACAKPSAS